MFGVQLGLRQIFHTMAQKVRKRPENELLDIKISASNGFQNKNLKFKRREREQKLEIFDPPRRPA